MSEILIAAMAFISTNIDDIFITALLFSTVSGARDKVRIVAGRYAGCFALLAASAAGAAGLRNTAGEYTHLLGIIPLILGIKETRGLVTQKEQESIAVPGGLTAAAALMTIAGGGDNIGVYLPLLTGAGPGTVAVWSAVFAVMSGLWCGIALALVSLPGLKTALEKHSRIITPAVYILLGIYILMG